MATATTSKSDFVRDFLGSNPQANAKSVNEAWTAAGMTGTISHPIVSEVRKELGLIGTQSAKTSKPAKKTPAPKKSKSTKKKPAPEVIKPVLTTRGKTSFVKEFLNDHSQGNVTEVIEAWKAAGFTGTISRTLVDKMRAHLGLTGNRTRKTKKRTSQSTARKSRATTTGISASSNGVETRGRKSNRTTVLMAVEEEIDRLIFAVMGIGNLPEIETALREARRGVYKALTS
jgi:hypothetical protein